VNTRLTLPSSNQTCRFDRSDGSTRIHVGLYCARVPISANPTNPCHPRSISSLLWTAAGHELRVSYWRYRV